MRRRVSATGKRAIAIRGDERLGGAEWRTNVGRRPRPGRDPAARARAARRRGLGRARAGLRRRRLRRRSPRNLDQRRGLHARRRARPSRRATTPPACRCSRPASTSSPGAFTNARRALLLALLGTLAVLFTYLIGRRLSGPAAGLIGAGAIAIYPALLEYQGMLMGEPLAATLLSGAVWQCSGQMPDRRTGARVLSWGGGPAGRPWLSSTPRPAPPARQMAVARPAARSAGAGAAGVPRRRLARELGGAR